ncbi:MAG TPA: Pr6Pr family membrane protein [Solirubrobacteraceae bacterium]|jgi:hypothetical protein
MSSQPAPAASAVRRSGPQVGREAAIRVYRVLGAIAVLAAIAYQLAKGLAREGISTTDYFSYFTELSNLFAAAMFLHGSVRMAEERSRTVEMLRGAAVVYMLTTGIVYAVLLSGHVPIYPWVNTILHRVIPLAVVLDWLIDPPRVRLEPIRTIALWMAFPTVYIAYTLARGAIVDWYPYFFVNPHRHGGYLLVAADCTAVTVGIVGLILATTWVGNRRSG